MSEKQTVYVVLSECGEYSDRMVWVGGGFSTHEAAKAYVLDASRRSRAWNEWHTAKEAFLMSLGIDQWWNTPLQDQMTFGEFANMQKAALAKWLPHNPEPQTECGERFEIQSVTLDDYAPPVTVEELSNDPAPV